MVLYSTNTISHLFCWRKTISDGEIHPASVCTSLTLANFPAPEELLFIYITLNRQRFQPSYLPTSCKSNLCLPSGAKINRLHLQNHQNKITCFLPLIFSLNSVSIYIQEELKSIHKCGFYIKYCPSSLLDAKGGDLNILTSLELF